MMKFSMKPGVRLVKTSHAKISVCLFTLCALFIVRSFAQDTVYFTKGLALNAAHRYGREALYTDHLAYQLFTNTQRQPANGDSIGMNSRGQSMKWQTVEADSIKRFRSRGFGGGYLYLTYNSESERPALLNISGNAGVIFNGASHAGDPYGSGWLYVPVQLKKGLNELYVRSGGFTTAKLVFPKTEVQLNTEDPTLPSIVLGQANNDLKGAVVVINASNKALTNYSINASLEGNEVTTALPTIPAFSSRKVIFGFNGSGVSAKGFQQCRLVLSGNNKVVDEKTITIEAAASTDKYSVTFVSNIDGSLQYYAVAPQTTPSTTPSALFLSVHGAGVEAIGQARAYKSKDWGNLVAATNRRPRGFNWEDWGRLDALEVLGLAKDKFKPDPQQIYLTGHSMGGHGTWFLGATYPDKWAAIAPCAGYPTLKEYGSADGLIPAASTSVVEQMLLRSSNQSDVLNLVNNYKPLGVYIFHGDSDKVVPVRYARQMRKVLGEFHPDLSYYEYPGGEHWFGDHSVDWKPLFDFFKWHQRLQDSEVNTIDFTTSSPGISSDYRWASIQQQIQPLQYSRIQLSRNKRDGSIKGTTTNIALLKLDLSLFGANTTVHITLDSLSKIQYTTKTASDTVYLASQNNQWVVSNKPSALEKNPTRYGTFKEAFNHRMVFVYGTKGNKEENEWSYNKARYDAETWYYRGNGAVDIIADKDFSPAKYSGRNVIVFGNKSTNGAYQTLLSDCPIQIDRNKVKVGNDVWTGDDYGAYFVWPIKNSNINSVGVVAGSGLKGMNASVANQYFAGGSGFPDFMIFRLGMLDKGVSEVKTAGFFDNEWKLANTHLVQTK